VSATQNNDQTNNDASLSREPNGEIEGGPLKGFAAF
jgi:hypothetical protein